MEREPVERTTILLVDDETIVRDALKRLLESRGMFTVIGQACNGLEGIALAKELRPQIIIMDVMMPVMNGIDATRQIIREMPESKVLVLSRNSDDEVVEKMLAAGAISYLNKHSTGKSVVQAVRETKKGHSCFSPAIAERLHERMGEPFRRAKENESLLTQREAEVLQLLAETDSKHAIAHELGISVAAVVEHQKQVMQKLRFHEVEALTRYAMNQGSWARAESGDG
ncbi:MAG: LuxR family transcriptional regulator [Verrucomicrobiales bacterium]|nr:LuxR family transcriptional regulator [Verrucomicrobiales bacterium]